VERGRVACFSRAIGETDPVHRDSAAAQAAGGPDIVAPVTFPIAIRLDYEQQLADLGVASAMTLINYDCARLLHGEERYNYAGPIFAGDTVDVITEITGFEDKKGGAIELARLTTRITHPERGLLVIMVSTAIHRLA
jgi:acyl dehydratase